jgi:hypothetical protein
MQSLRFMWVRTWPGDRPRVDDGHVPQRALDSPTDVLRVFQIIGGPQNAQWFWTVSRLGAVAADGLRRPPAAMAFCATKGQAQEAAEEAYLGEAKR